MDPFVRDGKTFLLFFLFFAGHGLLRSTAQDGGELKIEILYESQCPACYKWLREQLMPTVQQLGGDVLGEAKISFEILPFGNAKETTDEDGHHTFQCQHGPTECYLNAVEACGLQVIEPKNVEAWLPWVACVEDASAFPPKQQSSPVVSPPLESHLAADDTQELQQPAGLPPSSLAGVSEEAAPLESVAASSVSNPVSSAPAAAPILSSSVLNLSPLNRDRWDSLPPALQSFYTLVSLEPRRAAATRSLTVAGVPKKNLLENLTSVYEAQAGTVNADGEAGTHEAKGQTPLPPRVDASNASPSQLGEKYRADEALASTAAGTGKMEKRKHALGDGEVYEWLKCRVPTKDSLLDRALIFGCAETEIAANVMHEVAARTVAHDYVPWILVNGEHSAIMEKSLRCGLCRAVNLDTAPAKVKEWCKRGEYDCLRETAEAAGNVDAVDAGSANDSTEGARRESFADSLSARLRATRQREA
ncbi:hypothetical protein BESB_019250 [Besnoitia besnoiti]|uniref:Gamma interferon inducible lysosomal thiol reductase (GILT) protein n=1 Tax=Besnoitia besnoiti TaxID=94643 RepID=A0A2A9M433_BESBE|nr:hypothetical protein BESB_019250 [Besnoitia besnoiti]PFH31984.1 hypothetical protein BESB_019250 [Besnoitia besnoiti]